MQKKTHKKQYGFTLLEVLLSVALISAIVGIGAPVLQSFQNRNDLSLTTTNIVQSLRRAQALSQSGDRSGSWGVHLQNGEITMFQGSSYALRNNTLDEISKISLAITFSGVDEVTFAELSGEPSTTGTITVTSNINEARNITINEKGILNF